MIRPILLIRSLLFVVALGAGAIASFGCAAMPSPASPMAEDAYGPPSREAPDMAGGASPAAPGMAAPPGAMPADGSPTTTAPPGGAAGSAPAAAKDVASGGDDKPGIAQMLIYIGQLHLQVDAETFAATLDRVVDLAIAAGGYISRQDNQSVEVRVPSAEFRRSMTQMEKLGVVTHRSVQVQDVTEEFHDLGVRLKSLKATRDRLEQFLERAKNIAEVLEVERELSRLNGQIDTIEGRMRYLAAQASFSTITVALQPKPKQQVIVEPEEPDAPPPPQTLPLPIDWLSAVGLDRLLQLNAK